MVECSARLDGTLDATFHALSNGTRRALLARLGAGPATISQLAEPFDMSFFGVSKHLRVLEEAGLVERRVEGREHRFEVRPAALTDAERWIRTQTEFWERALDNMDRFLTRRRPRRRPPE